MNPDHFNLASALSHYLTLNFLVAIAWLLILIFLFIARFLNYSISAQNELNIHYHALIALILTAISLPLLPKKPIFEPVAKIWSAQNLNIFSHTDSSKNMQGYFSFSKLQTSPTLTTNQATHLLFAVFLVIGITGLFILVRDLHSLLKIKHASFLIKKIKNVSIYGNDSISVPFSFWMPGQNEVVIPTKLLDTIEDYRVAVYHELQHHRQRDTRWIYVVWFLKMFCFFNPFTHLWARQISEAQEFACDEALVDRNKVDSQQYARCLVRVAETALNQKYAPACATGLIFLTERLILKRRIEKMMSQNKRIKTSVSGLFALLSFSIFVTTALATQGLVQDRRITLEMAEVLAKNASADSKFPIVVNDLVLKQLNRYIGTPEGRKFMSECLTRLKVYRPMITKKIDEYDVPVELLAIPIVESGYENLKQSTKHTSAGLWMFIPSTAIRFGMKVNSNQDDRLDTLAETDAAMRYLKSNYHLFNEWWLAILAYNIGENHVQNAIEATHSRDAWNLIGMGYEGDKDYLPEVMAAIIILKNPSILN